MRLLIKKLKFVLEKARRCGNLSQLKFHIRITSPAPHVLETWRRGIVYMSGVGATALRSECFLGATGLGAGKDLVWAAQTGERGVMPWRLPDPCSAAVPGCEFGRRPAASAARDARRTRRRDAYATTHTQQFLEGLHPKAFSAHWDPERSGWGQLVPGCWGRAVPTPLLRVLLSLRCCHRLPHAPGNPKPERRGSVGSSAFTRSGPAAAGTPNDRVRANFLCGEHLIPQAL